MKLKNIFYFISSIFFISFNNLYGQKLTGKIVDPKTNEPLVGAIIEIKGTNFNTSTDADGNFSMLTPATPFTLAVNSLGYVTLVQVINSIEEPVNLKLKSEQFNLMEVDVIARGFTENNER
jgi:hypothetical protein